MFIEVAKNKENIDHPALSFKDSVTVIDYSIIEQQFKLNTSANIDND